MLAEEVFEVQPVSGDHVLPRQEVENLHLVTQPERIIRGGKVNYLVHWEENRGKDMARDGNADMVECTTVRAKLYTDLGEHAIIHCNGGAKGLILRNGVNLPVVQKDSHGIKLKRIGM